MSRNTRLSRLAANTQADAFAVLLNGGYLRIYGGLQPADANEPLGDQPQLAELRFGPIAFGLAADGVIKANAIRSDEDAANTGKATWFRCFRADGITPVLDGSAGASGCNLVLRSPDIQQHAQVSVSNFTHVVVA